MRGLLTMGQQGKRQLGLFQQDMISTIREDGTPVYRICLVREGTVPYYDQQIRSSADASLLLHKYLEGTDRENFVVILGLSPNKRQSSLSSKNTWRANRWDFRFE